MKMEESIPDELRFFTPKQVAEMFQVNVNTVRSWVYTGQIKVVRIGNGGRKQVYIPLTEIKRFGEARFDERKYEE